MKRLIFALVAALLFGGVAVGATNDHKGQKAAKHERAVVVHDDGRARVTEIHVSFSSREIQIIRQYYAPQYRNLPKGMQKKLARTGTLPPGWQKKMRPFPIELERDLVVLPAGYRRGVMDGHAVIYQPKTQVIVDVAVLF